MSVLKKYTEESLGAFVSEVEAIIDEIDDSIKANEELITWLKIRSKCNYYEGVFFRYGNFVAEMWDTYDRRNDYITLPIKNILSGDWTSFIEQGKEENQRQKERQEKQWKEEDRKKAERNLNKIKSKYPELLSK